MSRGRLLAAAYVVTVATLTAVAFVDKDHERWWARIAAAVLCLPTIVPALPAIYVGGAVAWSFSDDPASGSASSAVPVVDDSPMWPVTLTFMLMMTAIACVNLLVLRAIARRTPRPRLDRPLLVSSLASGALWLLLLVPWGEPGQPGGWFMLVIGAAYVGAASVLLAAVRGRDDLTRLQETGAWVLAWLVSVAMWTVISAGMDADDAPALTSWAWGIIIGGFVGTGCFLAWQGLALPIRYAMRWPAADLTAAAATRVRTRSGS